MRTLRFTLLALVLAVVAGIVPFVGGSTASAEGGRTGYPNSMASTGDSITRAFETCFLPFTDCPANSWSTGTSGSVNSHYLRIKAANAAINGRNNNDAVTGAKMSDLLGQVSNVNAQHVDYVTILMGANDVCTSSESTMTPVATFQSQFQAAMASLSANSPNARIYVVSIPNIYNLYSVLKGNFWARLVWGSAGICQSMLANPTSNSTADVQRRARVQQRNIDFNTVLKNVCVQYVHCRFDNNAAYNTTFAASNVSTVDYFHPNTSGQALAATKTWAATFNFTDATAPTDSATATSVSGGKNVTISASDNVAVSGIEYKINGGTYQKYSGTVFVATGSVIEYRAVDVNGNYNASATITG